MKIISKFFLVCLASLIGNTLSAQDIEINDIENNEIEKPVLVIKDTQKESIQKAVASLLPDKMGIGNLKANAIEVVDDSIKVDLSENFGDIPFTRESVTKLKSDIKSVLGEDFGNHNVYLTIAGNDIENYFSDFEASYQRKHNSFITPVDANRQYKKGLSGNIVAVWPSHGWYFEPYLNRWEWQRARLFQTVEDMYTHSYMIPFPVSATPTTLVPWLTMTEGMPKKVITKTTERKSGKTAKAKVLLITAANIKTLRIPLRKAPTVW